MSDTPTTPESELIEEAISERTSRGNKWYYFIPLMVAAGLLVLANTDYWREDLSMLILPSILFEYFVIILQKRLSKWWFLTFFFVGLNVIVYLYFLFAVPRRAK